jgi:hypothetical protein
MAALCVLSCLITGCVSQSVFSEGTGTQVNLSGNNCRLVKAEAKGHGSGFRLPGIIPFTSPNYAEAKARLYRSVDEPLPGRSIALANRTEDGSTLYLILFSIPKVTITAGLVEFTDRAASK